MSLIPNEITSFDGFGTDSSYSGYLWYSPAGTVSEERVRILGELVHNHPMFRDVVFRHLEKTAKITQYLSLAKFQETALYHEFYRHIGGDTQMMTAFTVSPELYVVCTQHRTQKDFTERDLEVLEILAPHLKAAFLNARFIQRLGVEAGSIGGALGGIGYGIVTIDADLNICHQNLAAVRMLHEYFPPSNSLPDELTRYVKHCGILFSSAEIYLPPAPLIVKKLDARLKIRLSFQTNSQTIVIFMEETKEPSPVNLMKFGLTRREAEILLWMTKGKTDADIAFLGGISVRMVHKHRENIFKKCGVETRTAAAAVAIEIMSGH